MEPKTQSFEALGEASGPDGAGSAAELARLLSDACNRPIKPSHLYNWARRDNGGVPPDVCVQIEQLGFSTRQSLRPNDFHLIWPELASEQAA